MKVFFDVITNHTADVIDYAEEKYAYIAKGTSRTPTRSGSSSTTATTPTAPGPSRR